MKPLPNREYHFVVSLIQTISNGLSGVLATICIITPNIIPIIVPIIVLIEKLTCFFFKRNISANRINNIAKNVSANGELIIKKSVKKELFIK